MLGAESDDRCVRGDVGGSSPTALPGRLLCQADSEELPRQWIFAGPEARARWAANRARGAHCVPTRGVGVGKAPGSEEARQRARTLTLVCCRVGCVALVNKARARQQAHAAGRSRFVPGDGCASQRCSRDFRPRRFARVQRAMAEALERGERALVCWPADISDRDVWVRQAEAVARAVREAREALGQGP